MSGSGGGNVQIDAPAGDPQALMTLADQLDKHATSVGNLGTSTLTTTQGIQSAANWTGSAASAYGTFTGNTAHAVTGFENPLHSVATSIRTYAGVLKSAQQQVATAVTTANKNIKANPGSAQTEISGAQTTASSAASDVKKAGDQAASEIGDQKSGFDEFMEKIEPGRQANEWAHLPFDASASDVWLDKVLDSWKDAAEGKVTSAKAAQAALEKDLQQTFDDEVGSVAHDYDNGEASMEDVESAFAKYASSAKTATSAAADTVDSAETGLSLAKGAGAASEVMGGLGIAGDVLTIIDPPDKGALGHVDQVAAGGNAIGTGAVLLALNAGDEVPVWGEAMAAGTGLYLAGDFVYDHRQAIGHAFVAAGHGLATAGKAVGHGLSTAAHWIGL
ncbi:MAG TPA: hypothetical protein VHX38_41695 [Pseudonocardiaceae bacterium]|jgi:uncharacterized protein YukE|nr:hypothetical protein [Pseudonocardiaceae bacterium]